MAELTPVTFPRTLTRVPVETGKEQFFARLKVLIAEARRLQTSGFGDQEPEEATKQHLLEPLFEALGFTPENQRREFKILGDSVDYLLREDAETPLLFVEAKRLNDPAENLFTAHKEQVLRYIRNYRVSPEQTRMEQPVTWILLTNFAQFHLVRVSEAAPTFSFALGELWSKRDDLWDLLALENLEAGRIEELFDQHLKATLDQRFLADLKRWRLMLANGFALRNQARSLAELTLASQQLLNRFLLTRMLETNRLIDWNKLARAYQHYETFYGDTGDKAFAEFLRESIFSEIKKKFNTELFVQPLLCDTLPLDNSVLSMLIGHEPLSPEVAATCGFESGQGELLSFRHLYNYDFSRMSADVMGSVYERFLAHKLSQSGGRIVIEDTDELRKKEGIYYTPKYIVDYIVAHTLGEKTRPVVAEAKALLGYKNFKGAFAKIRELQAIKVLDPAMGSGSFLLGAFDHLVAAYADYNADCQRYKKEGNGSGALFDAPDEIATTVENAALHVLTENLHGVDLDSQALEVAKLNFWIRYMAVERYAMRVRLQHEKGRTAALNLLPTLTANFKHGNSLIADKAVAGDTAFDWEKDFPDANKFDVVIGNPPYVIVNEENCGKAALKFYESLSVAEFKIDLFHLFIQRGIDLMRQGGKFGYIIPSPWLTLQYTSRLRQYILEHSSVKELVIFSHQVFQDADVHTCLLMLEKSTAKKDHLVAIRHPDGVEIESAKQSQIAQSSWCHPPAYIIETRLTGQEKVLIERLVSQFPKLESLARASLGCQAYNSSKHTAEQIEKRVFHADKKAGPEYLPELAGNDVGRYEINRQKGEWIKYGPWLHDYRTMDWLEGPRILIREIPGHPPYMIQACYVEETFCNYKTILNVNPLPNAKLSMKFLAGLLNSRLLSFVFPLVSNKMVAQTFPRLSVGDIKNLPIASIDFSNRKEKAKHDKIASLTNDRLTDEGIKHKIRLALDKSIRHSQRTPCNLAHYLQKDFAAAVTAEILIDDVQRAGFVHAIQIDADGKEVTLTATVSADGQAEPSPFPVLRLAFKDAALQHFIYASWKHFLAANSRQRKWTKGKKPEAIYPLLVNTLEPLVYFDPAAGDNLRLIRDLMKTVTTEAGSADLAAIETEIQRLDAEIDARVYELYGLTEAEIKIVEGRQ